MSLNTEQSTDYNDWEKLRQQFTIILDNLYLEKPSIRPNLNCLIHFYKRYEQLSDHRLPFLKG